jgi:hypothetical protein
MMLDEVATYLTATFFGAVTPHLISGTNLFTGRMTETPDFAIALYEYPGGVGGYLLGGGKRRYENPRLQVIIRDAEFNYASTRDMLERIVNVLDNITDVTLSGTKYLRIEAVSTPMPLPADAQDRVMFSVDFNVIKELSGVASP